MEIAYYGLTDVSVVNKNNVFAVGGSFVLRTFDGGYSWALLYPLGYQGATAQFLNAPHWTFIKMANAAQGFIGGANSANFSWCAAPPSPAVCAQLRRAVDN